MARLPLQPVAGRAGGVARRTAGRRPLARGRKQRLAVLRRLGHRQRLRRRGRGGALERAAPSAEVTLPPLAVLWLVPETCEHSSRRLVLVRHARVRLDPEVPPERWELTDEGRADGAERLAALFVAFAGVEAVVTSPEPKARATAEPIACRGGPRAPRRAGSARGRARRVAGRRPRRLRRAGRCLARRCPGSGLGGAGCRGGADRRLRRAAARRVEWRSRPRLARHGPQPLSRVAARPRARRAGRVGGDPARPWRRSTRLLASSASRGASRDRADAQRRARARRGARAPAAR